MVRHRISAAGVKMLDVFDRSRLQGFEPIASDWRDGNHLIAIAGASSRMRQLRIGSPRT